MNGWEKNCCCGKGKWTPPVSASWWDTVQRVSSTASGSATDVPKTKLQCSQVESNVSGLRNDMRSGRGNSYRRLYPIECYQSDDLHVNAGDSNSRLGCPRNSADTEFRGIFWLLKWFLRNSGEIPRNSAEFRGISPELHRKSLPYSAECQNVTSVDTLLTSFRIDVRRYDQMTS